MFRIHDSYGVLSESDIEQFETESGLEFPEAYKMFLLQSNGGCFRPLAFFRDTYISNLYGINTGMNHSDLGWNIECLAGRIPDELIPIGDTPVGDAICLQVRGEEIGSVYFWDHENECEAPTLAEGGVSYICECFSELLDGLHVEHDPPPIGESPEVCASATGDTKTLANLISAGSDPNMRAKSDETLLMVAIRYYQPDTMELLCDAGARIEETNSQGRTALFIAIEATYLDAARLLLERGANPNAIDDRGFSPLIEAAATERIRIADLLLSSGAEVNYQTPAGETALSCCINYHAKTVLRPILIEAGAQMGRKGVGSRVRKRLPTPFLLKMLDWQHLGPIMGN